jgi:hypothetical protein
MSISGANVFNIQLKVTKLTEDGVTVLHELNVSGTMHRCWYTLQASLASITPAVIADWMSGRKL